MKVSAEDYAELKAFYAAIWPMLDGGRANLPPEDMPIAVLERVERRWPARARAGLGMAIGDMVERCQGIAPQQIIEIDHALGAQGLLTLSGVRARFLKKTNAIMRRGNVRNESEYYALKNVADAMPQSDREKAWTMLGAFETR